MRITFFLTLYMSENAGKRTKNQRKEELYRFLKQLGGALAFLRKSAGYTNAEIFAAAHEINRSQYARYEAGSTNITVGTLLSVVALFGLSAEDVFNPAFLKVAERGDDENLLIEKALSIAKDQVKSQVVMAGAAHPTDQVLTRLVSVLTFCLQPRSRKAILRHLGLYNSFQNFRRSAGFALEHGWISMTIPDKPNSRVQRYVTTDKGKALLEAKHK